MLNLGWEENPPVLLKNLDNDEAVESQEDPMKRLFSILTLTIITTMTFSSCCCDYGFCDPYLGGPPRICYRKPRACPNPHIWERETVFPGVYYY